jgi:hypothetical protein
MKADTQRARLDVAQHNAAYVRQLVRVGLEELTEVRQAHGADSAAYREGCERVARWLVGSVEAVLTAAHQALDHDAPHESRPPTRTE